MAIGFGLTVVGTIFKWVHEPAPSTAEAVAPWNVTGLFPERLVLIVFVALYVVTRLFSSDARLDSFVLAVSGLASIFYPLYRFSQAPVNRLAPGDAIAHLVPGIGFYLTHLGGIILVVAATYRYATTISESTH